MKLKKTRKERVCTQCDTQIKKGDQYGQKTQSLTVKETSWSIDDRPKEEIPDWAWSNHTFQKTSDWCSFCAEKETGQKTPNTN